ncbi:MAG: hypothetical protein JWO95_2962 [Verrucomicrobiales bacterium]|nr:hypothetical protein [Verrucomicrobiales bacterium]
MNTLNSCKERWAALVSAAAVLVAVALMISGCGDAPKPAAKKTDDKSKVVQTSTNEVAMEVKAEFDDDLKTSKDPFFPNSKRRVAKVASGKTVAELPRVADIRLRGVIGSPGKYIAMINDKTFAEGDKSQISVGLNQSLVIKVTTITAKTVTVFVDGEAAPRELILDAIKEARK